MIAFLLTEGNPNGHFADHNLLGQLGGDQKARYEACRINRESGRLRMDEIREWDNLPKIESGNENFLPVILTVLAQREGSKNG
jgi:hypothetical protein